MAKKKKTEYLSYLEDTKKHHSIIENYAKSAVKEAIEKAKSLSIDITYLKDEKIVNETPSGKITVIGFVPNNRRIVKIGSKDTLLN